MTYQLATTACVPSRAENLTLEVYSARRRTDVIEAAAAVVCGDRAGIGRLFSGLSAPIATKLVHDATRYLAAYGQRTGRWEHYAQAPWLLPGGWGGPQAWHRDLDAYAKTMKPANELAHDALDLRMAGLAPADALDELHAINKTAREPIPPDEVDRIALFVWAGTQPEGASHDS